MNEWFNFIFSLKGPYKNRYYFLHFKNNKSEAEFFLEGYRIVELGLNPIFLAVSSVLTSVS